ncbi:HpcH/HpaI aldolase family protein [Desulfovibrio litoralis]|uniref:2-dehydro-3-deoxyglucarate aldolase n=1 Tax=Desulfovibrio litoralis DSM 11393 TaxID=1121455 RepID=A0A1M7SXN2_9BACT|nr:aldolase/citrate lyase family protein [Desulfovibrio litoralis]SHN63242.1 2-dehydro-3-deoxyglucarate aldolase [Desulfovibrio litoralis DSM 11393]
MIASSEIRNKLHNGQASIGTWLQLTCPESAEIIGRMGYDWAAVDMEHGSFSRTDLPNIFRALELGGTLPFARVAEPSLREIKIVVDSGARGVIFPFIEDRETLDKAIAYSLYPNTNGLGKRGVGFCRANCFGLDFSKHIACENPLGESLVLVAQIESIKAVKNLDEIFSQKRLDAYIIGPYDLSASMGLTGQFNHPDFIAALKEIELVAKKYNVPKGFHIVEPNTEFLKEKIAEGYVFLAYGIDALFLMRSAKAPLLK